MKQTITSRFLSALRGKSLLAGLMCLTLVATAPLPVLGAEQRRGRDEQRTEQRRHNGNEGRRNNGNEGRRNSGGNRRPANDRGHGNSGNNSRPTNRPDNNTRPGQGHKPDNNGRPGNNGNHNNNWGNNARPDQGHKPGNNVRPGQGHKPDNNGRPGNNGNHNNNWGNNGNHNNNWGNNARPDHNRPGNNHTPGHSNATGHQWRPGHVNQVRPGAPIHRPQVAPPPMRPYRPAHFHGYHRPAPPRGWRPGPRPLFTTVLGLSFGAAFNVSIDALISSGYAVDGYCDNMVYVNNVTQLNMRWPYGVLQYSKRGYLEGSEFVYDSPWRDTARYNMAYNRLCQLYGPPMDSFSRGGELGATWWGPDGQFVSLRFDYRAPMSGAHRYFTTLSFGI